MWNSCIKIYNDSEYIDGVDITMPMVYALQRYMNVIGHDPRLQVWYDPETDICFGPEQHFYANPADFSFFSLGEQFLTNQRGGKEHVLKYLGSTFGPSVVATEEYIIKDSSVWDKYKDKTILMVGGGPSTSDVDWESMNLEYDFLWSCNNFFMNDSLDRMGVDFASIGPTVDLDDKRFRDHLEKHNTVCAIEGGISPFRSKEDLLLLNNLSKEEIVYYHLRYFSKLGTLARMVCLATHLKAKEILFVGMDGYPGKSGDLYKHAFEGGSKEHQGRTFSYNLHRRQYVLLWDYLLNTLGSKSEYQNLGEGHPANQSTDISAKTSRLSSSSSSDDIPASRRTLILKAAVHVGYAIKSPLPSLHHYLLLL